MSLGRHLHAERDRRRLSLRDAAEEIGVSFNTLYRVEQGADCMHRHALAIIRWLDASAAGDERAALMNVERAAREVDAFFAGKVERWTFDRKVLGEGAADALLSLHDYLNDVELARRSGREYGPLDNERRAA